MKENLFPNETNPKVIEDNLMGMADKVETGIYMRQIPENELAKIKDEYVQDSLKFAKLQDDFQKVKEEFKGKMKPIEQLKAATLKVLKTKSVEVEGKMYLIADQEEKLMKYYDNQGNFLHARPLTMEERQLTIHRDSVAV